MIGQFIDTDGVGGAETMLLRLSRHLLDAGWPVKIVHFNNLWLEDAANRNCIPCDRIGGEKYYRSWKTLPLFMGLLARYLRTSGIKVLHTHLLPTAIASSPACRIANVGHVATLHDRYSLEAKSSGWQIKAASALGTVFCAVSEDIGQAVNERVPTTIDIVRNGVDLSFRSRNYPGDKRQDLGLTQRDRVLVSVGRLVPLKRHDLLIEAVRLLEDVVLLVIGDGPERTRLERMVARYGLEKRVHLLGTRDDVEEILSISDVFVLASITEGMSCSLLEAMAAGLPVVATAVGGTTELVVDGETGFLVSPGSVDDLVNAIRRVDSDGAARMEMGRRAAERVSDCFSLQNMTEKYLRVYRRIHYGKVGLGSRLS